MAGATGTMAVDMLHVAPPLFLKIGRCEWEFPVAKLETSVFVCAFFRAREIKAIFC